MYSYYYAFIVICIHYCLLLTIIEKPYRGVPVGSVQAPNSTS